MVSMEERRVTINRSVHAKSANVMHNDAVNDFDDSATMRVHKPKVANISTLSINAVKRRALFEKPPGKNWRMVNDTVYAVQSNDAQVKAWMASQYTSAPDSCHWKPRLSYQKSQIEMECRPG